MTNTDALVRFVCSRLAEKADPQRAIPMQAYLKTKMPMLGVSKPDVRKVVRQTKKLHPLDSVEALTEAVLALWEQPHRETHYVAIHLTEAYKQWIGVPSLPLYEKMIREGAWWDLVDPVASNLLGIALLRNRASVAPLMEKWIRDPDRWIRRTALLSQLRHKGNADENTLFQHCLLQASEQDFFIRKAIGWALRTHSIERPEAVVRFIDQHSDVLSRLSVTEGSRRLVRSGYQPPSKHKTRSP